MSRKFVLTKDYYEEGINLYKKKTITIKPGVTVLVGCNGIGKTKDIKRIKTNFEREYLMPTISKKELEDYRQLCKDRSKGKILTPDGLRFICQACNYDPEEIGKQMLENMARICNNR